MKAKNKSCLRILIAEDHVGDARLVTELLREAEIGEHEVTYVDDPNEITEFLAIRFDVILLDLHLSDMKPLDSFKRVYVTFPKTPIVIMTGLKDDQLASKIVRLGAQDYLIKGTFSPETLKRSILYSIDRKKAELRLTRSINKSKYLKVKTMALEDETKRLETVNKAKDTFLSIASHQLRTPATSVKQYLGMIIEGYGGEVPELLSKFIHTAYRNNERQLKIVDDILNIARLDAGRINLNYSEVDINKLLMSVVEDIKPSFREKQHEIIFKPTQAKVLVKIDENNMRMVFENLLDNALKYSKVDTKIHLTVQTISDEVLIMVEDHGIGIAEEDIGKLFQKFSRVGQSFSYAPNGSGLGLYWAQEVTKLHGGRITVKSVCDIGSTFTVCIPHVSVRPNNVSSPDNVLFAAV